MNYHCMWHPWPSYLHCNVSEPVLSQSKILAFMQRKVVYVSAKNRVSKYGARVTREGQEGMDC
jgi:hypothetical protein